MDICNNKTGLPSNIKRFTLKATASALLTLHTGIMMAASCDSPITSTVVGVCDFDTGNSVTVADGGGIGGIVMSGYAPPDSSITVDVGGAVGNSTAIGIAISDSLLTVGLSNNGTINSSGATGIKISSNSEIDGGISNSGSINASSSAINIEGNSLIDGNLSNSWMINSSGTGIQIQNSHITGSISNSGSIDAKQTVINIEGSSTIDGGIFNSGTIRSHDQGTGIRIVHSTLSGDLSNSGTISGSHNDSGISIILGAKLDGDITNDGLINAVTGNAIYLSSMVPGSSTITGGIFNTGRIESEAQGIGANLSLIQGNIFNSGGTISGGTQGIAIHNASTLGTVADIESGNIFNNGIIHGDITGLAIFSTTRLYGGISNSGSISGGVTGLHVQYATEISGGISNSGTIQGDTYAIHITDGSSVNNIDILGKTARIIGDVDAVDTDVNITTGALFTSEGSYEVKAFKIEQDAHFNMAHSVNAVSGVNNLGTLAVTDLQMITGTYTQNTGAVFQTGVSSKTNYGHLFVTGTVNLPQNGNIDVKIQQNALLYEGDVLLDVIKGTGDFNHNGFNVSDNSFIWSFIPALNSTGNGFNLIATIDPAAYTVCKGAYCQGAADTIIGQVAAGNSLFNPYRTLLTASEFQAAASQATPELTNENIQMVRLMTQAVIDTVPMWGPLQGKSSGDAMLYPPGKIWIKPYGASMTQNEHNTVNGFNATAYGAVIGKGIELNNNWLFGSAFAVGGDNMHGKSALRGQSIDSNAYQGMLYGAKKFPNQLYLAGQSLIGYETNNTSRTIPLYATTAKSSFNSWFTNIRAEAGWSTYMFSSNWVFTPEIDASYLFINQGSYQESGSPMDLSVAANNNSSLVLGAYGNGAYHLTTTKNQLDLTLTGYVGIAGDVMNSQPQTMSTFVAGGPSFSTFGVQFNGLVFRGGAGLTIASQAKPFLIELNYDVQTGNNAYSGIGAATIKYKV